MAGTFRPDFKASPIGEVDGYAWAGALKERGLAFVAVVAIAFGQGAWPAGNLRMLRFTKR